MGSHTGMVVEGTQLKPAPEVAGNVTRVFVDCVPTIWQLLTFVAIWKSSVLGAVKEA